VPLRLEEYGMLWYLCRHWLHEHRSEKSPARSLVYNVCMFVANFVPIHARAYSCVSVYVAHKQCMGACVVPVDSRLRSSFIGGVGFVSHLLRRHLPMHRSSSRLCPRTPLPHSAGLQTI
jgi:hypothetical protein